MSPICQKNLMVGVMSLGGRIEKVIPCEVPRMTASTELASSEGSLPWWLQILDHFYSPNSTTSQLAGIEWHPFSLEA